MNDEETKFLLTPAIQQDNIETMREKKTYQLFPSRKKNRSIVLKND